MSRRIEVIVRGNVSGFTGPMAQAQQKAQQATSAFRGMQPAIQNSLNSLTASGSRANAAASGISNVGNAAQSSTSKLKAFGESFKGNRGLVFGFAGLASAAGEAVGMLNMYDDAASFVAEDQAKLNGLMDEGVKSGQEYTQAQQELAKHERFLNMVRRNTALSLMDNIFFTTMAINGVIKLATENNRAAGMITKLKNVFRIASVETAGWSNGLSILNGAGSAGLVGATANSARLAKGLSPLEKAIPGIGAASVTAGGSLTTMGNSALGAAAGFTALAVAAGLAFEAITKVNQFEKLTADLVPGKPAKAGTPDETNLRIRNMLGPLGGMTEQDKKDLAAIDEWKKKADKIMEAGGIKPADLVIDSPEQLSAKIKDGMAKTGAALKNGVLTLSSDLKSSPAAAVSQRTFAEIVTGDSASMQRAIQKFQPLIPQIAQDLASTGFNYDMVSGHIDKYIEQLELIPVAQGGISKSVGDSMKLLAEQNLNAVKAAREGKGATDAQKDAEKNRLAVLEDQKRLDAEYIQAQDKIHEQMAQRHAETNELIGQENVLAQATGVRVSLAKLDWEQAQLLIAAAEKKVNGYKMEEAEIMAVAIANGVMVKGYDTLLNNRKDDVAMMAVGIASHIDFAKAITDTTERTKTFSLGLLDGVLQAKEFSTGLVRSQGASVSYRQALEAIVKSNMPFLDTTKQTTKQLEELAASGFQNAAEAAAQYRQQIDALQQGALGTFDNIIGADSKKDFKKAFKAFDFGGIPKKLRDDVRDMFSELRQGSKDADRTSNSLGVVSVALSEVGKATGDLKGKEIDKIMGKTADSLKKFASTDFELDQLLKVPGLFEQIKFNAQGIPGTIMKLNEAWKDHNITLDEQNEITGLYLMETGQLDQANQAQIDALKKLGLLSDDYVKGTDDSTESTGKYATELNNAAIAAQATFDMQKLVVEGISGLWQILADDLATKWEEILKDTATASQAEFDMQALVVNGIGELYGNLASYYSTIANSFINNTKSATTKMIAGFNAMASKVQSRMAQMASHFSKMMQSFINNAKSAANGVNSALDKIKDKTVTLTTIKRTINETVNRKEGGIEFATGGIISAKSGLSVSNGPTYLYGDNDSGREALAFIPFDEPARSRMLNQIDDMFGRTKELNLIATTGGGDKDIIVPIVINIGDQSYSFTRKYRKRQGQEVASLVGAG